MLTTIIFDIQLHMYSGYSDTIMQHIPSIRVILAIDPVMCMALVRADYTPLIHVHARQVTGKMHNILQ